MAKYDLHIQLDPSAVIYGGGFYGFGATRSIGISGVQKLVNLFAKYLLTPVGTDPTDLSYGTALPSLIGSNIDVYDTREILLLAVDKTTQSIKRYQRAAEISDAERLASASVTDYIVIPEAPGFSAQIYIVNALNKGATVLLPSLQTGSR